MQMNEASWQTKYVWELWVKVLRLITDIICDKIQARNNSNYKIQFLFRRPWARVKEIFYNVRREPASFLSREQWYSHKNQDKDVSFCDASSAKKYSFGWCLRSP